jgi:hypothetical protein
MFKLNVKIYYACVFFWFVVYCSGQDACNVWSYSLSQDHVMYEVRSRINNERYTTSSSMAERATMKSVINSRPRVNLDRRRHYNGSVGSVMRVDYTSSICMSDPINCSIVMFNDEYFVSVNLSEYLLDYIMDIMWT